MMFLLPETGGDSRCWWCAGILALAMIVLWSVLEISGRADDEDADTQDNSKGE